jgi:hypothetical protein
VASPTTTGAATAGASASGLTTADPFSGVSGSVIAALATDKARSKLGHDVLAIGDSVLLAGSVALEQRLDGDITVDAAVGRQVWSGIVRLAEYKKAGDLVGLQAIVIDLGTNGPMTPADVAQFRALAAGVPLLVFVNVRVPRPWQGETNASIGAVAGLPGLRIVNWYAASATPGALWPDGVHPDPKGQAIYANLIARKSGALSPTAGYGPSY